MRRIGEAKIVTCAVAIAMIVVASITQGFAQTPVPLNILWRVVVGSSDRMTTPNPGERNTFPLEGQIFYIPRDPIAGTATLYRLYNGVDHMDSHTAGEGGYGTEGPLGYAWASQPPGGSMLIRQYNPSTGDHALRHFAESLAGYVDELMGTFGYNRYNNADEALVTLSAGGVTIQSNGVAGGSLWRWFWNGMQFVNTRDYGRQIQTALFHGNKNPTEAGDQHSDLGLPAARRHGSPILNNHNSGTTQVTRAIPLDFIPENFGGGADHPVVWMDMVIGKDVTLNFNGMGSVAKYTTVVSVPTTLSNASIEIPTGYLRANFNRFWTYNAETDTLTEVTASVPNCNFTTPFRFNVNFGGVMISDSSGANAMGIYGVHTSQGGSVNTFTLWKFLCFDGGQEATSSDTVKWSAVFEAGTIFAGTTAFNTYIITETVNTVASKMRQLFFAGVR